MLRTTRITRHQLSIHRAMGFALASAALVAVAACGDAVELEHVGDVATPTASPPSTDSSVGVVTSETPVVKVTLSDGEKLYRDRQYGEAAELLAAYTDQNPDNPWGHYMLGLSAWKSGDLDRAEQAFVRSFELDSKHVKTLFNLTRVHLDQGRPKDARARVTEALALDSSSAEGYRLMGRVRAALNQPSEAIAAYRIALSRDPEDAWSMNNLGLIMIQQGNFEEALGPLARAVALDSTVAMFHNNLGIALEHTGRFTLATQAYRNALVANAGYTKAKLSLPRVEGRQDDPTVEPVELGTLAEAFDREIRGVQVGGRLSTPER
jgi:tetratricopeptide (TPR) repeat protein